jgi:hypothetical protein
MLLKLLKEKGRKFIHSGHSVSVRARCKFLGVSRPSKVQGNKSILMSA